jgi:hypothetical protein
VTKKSDADKAWILVSRSVRHRLNLYKTALGIADDSVLDQSEAITALLDKVGAPAITAAERIANNTAVAQ